MTASVLSGVRILLVEDELLIALSILDSLMAEGAVLEGPCTTLAQANAAAGTCDIDLAVLDIDVGGEEIFPAARLLRARSIPFVFYTGQPERDQLKGEFAGTPVCVKPSSPDHLIAALTGLKPLAA